MKGIHVTTCVLKPVGWGRGNMTPKRKPGSRLEQLSSQLQGKLHESLQSWGKTVPHFPGASTGSDEHRPDPDASGPVQVCPTAALSPPKDFLLTAQQANS